MGFVSNLFSFKNNQKSIDDFNNKRDLREYELPNIVEFVKIKLEEQCIKNYNERGLTTEKYEKLEYAKTELKIALKKCPYGDHRYKTFVLEAIKSILTKFYHINEKNINYIIKFDHHDSLTARDKFEIMLHLYKNVYTNDDGDTHGNEAFEVIFEKYMWLDKVKTIENETYYCVTGVDVHSAFASENIELTFLDKLQIVAQRVYSIFKGLGVIDEIRDMKIDGISGGVNGLPESFIETFSDMKRYAKQLTHYVPKSFDSVWVFYKGKSAHLDFLSFGSFEELQRVCKIIYRFENVGVLHRAKGHIITQMADGSRVAVLRPDVYDSWSFVVRKFDIPDIAPAELIKGKNAETVILLLEFIVSSLRNVFLTGPQGTGKTTSLLSLIRFIPAWLPLRLQELAHEMHLRKYHNRRNIITGAAKGDITPQNILDTNKKTEGASFITGETAEYHQAANVIHNAQVSRNTLTTGHMITPDELHDYFVAGYMLVNGGSEEKASEIVSRVIQFNIHWGKTQSGIRYIERITQFVPVSNKVQILPEDVENAKGLKDMFKVMTGILYNMSPKKSYQTINIIEYDLENNEYVATNKIHEYHLKPMKQVFSEYGYDHLVRFEEFLRKFNAEVDLNDNSNKAS